MRDTYLRSFMTGEGCPIDVIAQFPRVMQWLADVNSIETAISTRCGYLNVCLWCHASLVPCLSL